MSNVADKTGEKYGRLLVKSCFVKDGRTRWLCVSNHGKEEAFRLACEARENAIKELNAQGAGYSENHGK